MSRDTDDRELIKRLNVREESAIEAVFQRYYAALCFFATKITRDGEASKDIVQDVFARLFENRRYHYENTIALKAFLYNSVRNGAVDYLRLQEKSRKTLLDNRAKPAVNEEEIEFFELESDVLTKIFEAIEDLPEACRRIFKMSYFDRMSVQEISQTLNIAESTVKTQRQRAKSHLREWLQEIYSVVIFMFF